MNSEKIDLHYHQQLSALIDGELAPDQARFLLRRLQHDEELAACVDRWQLAGDVLRGNAFAPAPNGFPSRIAAAIASEAAVTGASKAPMRGRTVKWGGGALAASVAAVALFLVAPQVPDDAQPSPPPSVAARADAVRPATPVAAAMPVDAVPAVAATAAVDTQAAPRATSGAPTRRSATRTRQAARSAAVASQVPQRAVANGPLPVLHSIAVGPPDSLNGNPFSNVRVDSSAPRPWPRAVLPQYSNGAFNARYSGEQGARTFYPFDPKLPAAPVPTPPAPASGEDD